MTFFKVTTTAQAWCIVGGVVLGYLLFVGTKLLWDYLKKRYRNRRAQRTQNENIRGLNDWMVEGQEMEVLAERPQYSLVEQEVDARAAPLGIIPHDAFVPSDVEPGTVNPTTTTITVSDEASRLLIAADDPNIYKTTAVTQTVEYLDRA